MLKRTTVLAAIVAMFVPGIAVAKPAPDTLLDLRQPGVVAQALRDAGYRAEVKNNEKGEPFVLSAAGGNDFTIEFYGCKGVANCESYQFSSWYKAKPYFTIALTNEWNLTKRFLKIAIDKDGNLDEYMDFTAVGKTTYANFADIVDWYASMDSALAKFLDSKAPKSDSDTGTTKK